MNHQDIKNSLSAPTERERNSKCQPMRANAADNYIISQKYKNGTTDFTRNANIFDEIKSRLDITGVAERYGIHINRAGFAACPFHSEKTPSMKIFPDTNSFYCFGCGEGGDIIRLVRRLFELDALSAAKLLNRDFSLGLPFDSRMTGDEYRRVKLEAEKAERERERIAEFEAWEHRACALAAAYIRRLERIKREYKPSGTDDPQLYVRALINLDLWDYLYRVVFIEGDFITKVQFYKEYGREVEELARNYVSGRNGETA